MTKLQLMFANGATSSNGTPPTTVSWSEDIAVDHWEWDIQRDLIEVTDYQNRLFSNSKGQFFGASQAFIERLQPEDRAFFQAQLTRASSGETPGSWTFRLNAQKQLLHLQLQTELILDENGEPYRLVGLLRLADVQHEPLAQLSLLEDCLRSWAQDPVLNSGDWLLGSRNVCKTLGELLNVHFVSLWWFSKGLQALECVDRYCSQQGTFTTEQGLPAIQLIQAEAGHYFQQLISNQKLSCNDVHDRISLEQIYASYLQPNHIIAKFDTLIVVNGKPVGMLSLEHQSARQWQPCETTLVHCAANTLSQLRMKHEQLQLQLQLSHQRQQFQTFINKSTEGICRLRFEPRITTTTTTEQQVEDIINHALFDDINPAGIHLLGLCSDSLSKNPLQILQGSGGLKQLLSDWVHLGYQQSGVELHNAKTNGEARWLSATLTGLIEDQQLSQLWISLKDISDEKRHLETISYQAEHDSLTHLPNRFWLMEKLRSCIEEKQRLGGNLAVLLVDLDNFKEINNSLGHKTGDLLLRQIQPRLSRLLTEEKGVITRLGGDEFAILFCDISAQYAEKLARRCQQLLKTPFNLPEIKLEVNASIGIALYPTHADNEEDLTRCADVALYQAKQHHLSFAVYNPDQDEHCPKRLALLAELSQGIREDQLILHYQPQIDLAERAILGYEALVRWNHPQQGLISPNQFLHLAEMGDLIHPLTLWVLDQSLAQWKQWQAAGQRFQLAVNLATRSLLDSSTPDTIAGLLEKHQVPAQCLELEITETALIKNPKSVIKCLNQLHSIGVKLTLDDFGTQYSSIGYLKSLPLDNLKIDHSFVQQLATNSEDQQIVKAIISLAHSLNLKVVAEGVESQAALIALESMGCDRAQGFYFSEPKAVERLPSSYAETEPGQTDTHKPYSQSALAQMKFTR